MKIVAFDDARRFLDSALAWLMEAEAENNLTIGIALARADDPPPDEDPAWFATVEDGDRVVGTAFRTPPHMLGLAAMPPEAVPLLARTVAETFHHLPGVVGPVPEAEAFADLWAPEHGVRPRPEMIMGIYSLSTVVSSDPAPPGEMRLAGPDDLSFLIGWMEGFERDTGIFSTGAEATVRHLMETGRLWLWQSDGVPVSMAGASGTTPRGVRVGYVYTPPETRGRGFARILTAELSRRLLDEGRSFCFLYANLADPISNGIYRRIGYERVATATAIRFEE